jgi:hypothetical protein
VTVARAAAHLMRRDASQDIPTQSSTIDTCRSNSKKQAAKESMVVAARISKVETASVGSEAKQQRSGTREQPKHHDSTGSSTMGHTETSKRLKVIEKYIHTTCPSDTA